MKRHSVEIAITLCLAAAIASAAQVQSASRSRAEPGQAAAAEYTPEGRLKFPEHYREWVYLSSGIDMRYTEAGGDPRHSMFDNVFVDPRAYREFLRTGKWIDGAVLVLEVRGAAQKGSINRRGRYQTGELMGIETHVKDARRYPGGWAFIAFRGSEPAGAIPQSADCYSCHREHGALDTTFVQFYPTLLEVATRKGTLGAER